MKITNKISLIVCDIEGCITTGKGGKITIPPIMQLRKQNRLAQENKAIPLTLCTGRPQPFVEAFAQMLAIKWPCICENGAFLYDIISDKLLRHPDITEKHIKSLRKLKFLLEKEVQAKIPHRIEPGKEICISLNPLSNTDNYKEQIEKLFEKVKKYIDLDLFFITHSDSAVDITPKGINKASGINFLSKEMHIPSEEMFGIGDTEGDLPFLNVVGISGAPANANESVLKKVDYRSQRKHAYGVVELIKNLIRRIDYV